MGRFRFEGGGDLAAAILGSLPLTFGELREALVREWDRAQITLRSSVPPILT